MLGKSFKDLYRHVNVRMTRGDEKTFFDYLMLNGPSSSMVLNTETTIDDDEKNKTSQF